MSEGLITVNKAVTRVAAEPTARVVYVLASYAGQVGETLERVKEAAGHVDAIIVVAPDPSDLQAFSMEQEGELIRAGAVGENATPVPIVHQAWGDDLNRYRNAGLKAARDLKADWVLVGDPDEQFSAKVLADLKPKVVPQLEKMKLTAAGLMCIEAGEDAQWPEKVEGLDDLAKPPAGEGNQTTWHLKLFRLLPGASYEGTATRGILTCKEGFKSGNLPYHYSYTHRRSALRLWRNAAMAVYLGGGGADVGERNAMRGELLKVCTALNVGNWPLLEKYVTTFQANTAHKFGEPFAEGEGRWPAYNPLVEWCVRALTFKATAYGLDTRRLAEWAVFYHRDLLEDRRVAEGLLMPPKLTPEDEAAEFVTAAYLAVLKRQPDKQGLEGYVKLVLSGQLPRDQLAAALKGSEESRQRFGGEVENISVELPITSTLHLTDEWLTKVITGSKTWKDKWQPPLDVGRFLGDKLGKEFFDRFYELKAKDELTLNSFLDAVYATVSEKAKPQAPTPAAQASA